MTINIGPPGGKAKMKAKAYKTTTLRQFDGGWNVIDNELNMSPRYARIMDNFVRSPDGSVTARYGYEQVFDLRLGTETTKSGSVTLGTTNTSNRVVVNWTAHALSSGQHVRLKGLPTFSGIPASDFNRLHGIRVINANQFEIITRTAATATATSGANALTGIIADNHVMAGEQVNGFFFNNGLVIVDDIGEVIAINSAGTVYQIWNNSIANSLTGTPVGWGPTTFVSFHIIGGRLIIRNDADKPLELDFNRTPAMQYLGDPAAGGANAAVPIGSIGFTSGGYAFAAGKPTKPSELGISGKLVPGVWTGNPDPDDAVDIDMSKVSNATDPEITGIGEIRGKLLVAFRDSISIGTIGITHDVTVGSTTSKVHEPDFKDSIAQHGCISHRTIVSLGNDLLLTDSVGVPSVAQSQMSGQIVPDRASDLIEPALQENIARLSLTTQKNKAFALYNAADKQYMLFMPQYDPADIRVTPKDPITFLNDIGKNRFVITLYNHKLEEGNLINITGVTDIESNQATKINGQRRITSIIDENTFTVEVPEEFDTMDITGGGAGVTVQPINEETIGYVYSYNPKLKVRSWSRYRNLFFTWGARSINNTVYFGQGGRVYRFGTQERAIHADAVGVYDERVWRNNAIYEEGTRILDAGTVYQNTRQHISPPTGTFADYREDNPDDWVEYNGSPIQWVWEWPWGDFDKRIITKAIRGITLDTSGVGSFNASVFVDQVYRNPLNGDLQPKRNLDFVASDSAGFGSGDQPYGGGRRTGEQPLWAMPVYCKLVKLRFEGETTEPLRIIAVSIVYHEGTIRR